MLWLSDTESIWPGKLSNHERFLWIRFGDPNLTCVDLTMEQRLFKQKTKVLGTTMLFHNVDFKQFVLKSMCLIPEPLLIYRSIHSIE